MIVSALFLLLLSIFLSAGRNITTKISSASSETLPFFVSQAALFFAASILILMFALTEDFRISRTTVYLGIIYGILLIVSQWFFALSLKYGNTSVCTVIYSLGFIIPTLFGTFYYNEAFNVLDFIGLLVAVTVVLLNFKSKKGTTSNNKYLPLIMVAFFGSGGLGVMQKIQQKSQFAEEKTAFLLTAFILAFLCSVIATLLKSKNCSFSIKKLTSPSLCGLCFGGANLCNTILAGKLKSSVFFPLQNISTIMITAFFSIMILKEKFSKKTAAMIILAAVAIILLSL